jgi:hypothetical protein
VVICGEAEGKADDIDDRSRAESDSINRCSDEIINTKV